MTNPHDLDAPSAWVTRWAPLVSKGGRVLDIACGSGRHARYFAARGHPVIGVDRDEEALARMANVSGVEARVADLEADAWPFAKASFDAVIVVNYLHRPLFHHLRDALRPGGVLIYETFMIGNERFGRPANADFLLAQGELLARTARTLTPVAFEQGQVKEPRPAVVQRLCAARAAPDTVFLT
jgi:SAM-dependent methyltransferase